MCIRSSERNNQEGRNNETKETNADKTNEQLTMKCTIIFETPMEENMLIVN
jgi:hypothetical protein